MTHDFQWLIGQTEYLYTRLLRKKKEKKKIDLTIREIFKDGWIYKLIEIS